jgi:hypothetical protein
VNPVTTGAESLHERLSRALPVAMKARDRVAVAALRSALAAIANAEAVDPPQPPPPAQRPDHGGSGAEQLDHGGSGSGPAFAGAVAGLGATEVERRRLSGVQVEEVIRAEVAERETAAAGYERAGQLEHAERLRAEAKVLTSYLDQP